MIRAALRRAIGFLRSARLATWLLGLVGVWATFGSFIPQGDATNKAVSAWADSYPAFEPAVRFLGLHQAFTSPIFTALVLVLGVATGLCSWDRTKVALSRARRLRTAALADRGTLVEQHDLEVAAAPSLNSSEALTIAAQTLERLGIRTKARDGLLASVSTPFSVWGSPVFHWALFALMAVLVLGNLLRADGIMGVAVGETKADAPASYGVVNAGPLHDWSRVHRSVRVDGFDPAYHLGGIDRGPTPTVSLLDGTGRVLVTQRVYPNMVLKSGSLTIYPADYGLAAHLTLLNAKGDVTGSSVQLVDFSDTPRDGTIPVGSVQVSDSSGNPLLEVSVTVPLDRRGGVPVKQVPAAPAARFVVTAPGGATVLDQVVHPGESVALSSGDTLRLDDIGYYARLSLVDDGSIPLLYAALGVALLGLTLTVAARQQIVLVTVLDGADGVRVAARVRLWRNSSSSRGEIEAELTRALGGPEEGSTT